ncbi:MAG: hypothetical protein ACE5KM_14710 [Planctomycetaceae bacterium]
MADEREWQAWHHTAQLSAMIANANRDVKKKAKPFLPAEFHPLLLAEKKRRAKRRKAPITVLRDVFVEGRMPDLTGE